MIPVAAAEAGPTLAWRPADARRGALLLLPGRAGPGPWSQTLGAEFSEEGYEVVIVPPHEGPGEDEAHVAAVSAAMSRLVGPIFLLGFADGADLAWRAAARLEGVSAAAMFYPAVTAPDGFEPPLCPVVVHVARKGSLKALSAGEALAAAYPDVGVWFYEAGAEFASGGLADPDCASLALLRTRQLFHRTAGLREAGA